MIQTGILIGITIIVTGVIMMLLALSRKVHVNLLQAILGIAILCTGLNIALARWDDAVLNPADGDIIFTDGQVAVTSDMLRDDREMNVIFSSTVLDLREIQPGDTVKINNVFGATKILLPDHAVNCRVSVAFGTTKTLDQSIVFLGSNEYNIDRNPDSSGRISRIELNCAFGTAELVQP